jgi:hypothetical protein
LTELDTRQPTMRRENTSITKATKTNPFQVATNVKSATHKLVRPLGSELPLDQIRRPQGLLVGDRGLESTPANRTAQAHGAHQPLHRATRHQDLFAVQRTLSSFGGPLA